LSAKARFIITASGSRAMSMAVRGGCGSVIVCAYAVVASGNPRGAGSTASALSGKAEPIDHDAAIAKSANAKTKSITLSFQDG
jgi:hypothetical protein